MSNIFYNISNYENINSILFLKFKEVNKEMQNLFNNLKNKSEILMEIDDN